MLSFVRYFFVVTGVLVLLAACSRSHIPLQFEGADAYGGGNLALNSVIDNFKNTHDFQQINAWTVDLSYANTFSVDPKGNQLGSTEPFHVYAMAQTLTNQISSFYVVALNKADYHSADDYADSSSNTIDIKAINKEGITERVVQVQLIGDEFLIIDAY